MVEIWDHGHWSSAGDAEQAWEKGHLQFTLHGQRLKGEWTLVRTSQSNRQWLLIKRNDRHATSEDPSEPEAPSPTKDKTRRTESKFALQLATLAEGQPRKGEWIHEIKYDGYRVLIIRVGKKVSIRSRNGQDWTRRLARIAAATASLDCRSCVLDGELVMWDEEGRSSFSALQEAFSKDGLRQSEVMCFDLLEINGKDLRRQALAKRREHLKRLLPEAARPLRLSQTFEGPAEELRKATCAHGLEGIIAKDVNAPYHGGRNHHWLKLKCVAGDEFSAIGYTPGQGARAKLGSLLLAEWKQQAWHYAGRAGSGLSDDLITRLLKMSIIDKTPSDVMSLPTRTQLRGAKPVWLRKRPVVEVEYRARPRDGLLRQPSVKGVRLDNDSRSLQETIDQQSSEISIMLTHPDKLLFKEPAISKAQLAD